MNRTTQPLFRSLSALQAKAVPAVVVVSLALAAPLAMGQARELGRLGAELTPSGAEKAGTASGIPAWVSPESMGPGWTLGKLRADFFKYKADKPLFSIDAGNVDKYADKLNAGQVAVLKTVKGYTMDVYPSRRTCGVPDFVADNTKKNIGFAKLSADGASLEDAHLPGIPFPIPENGAEVMWNAKMHYRGVGLEMRNQIVAVSPRKGSTEWIKIVADSAVYFPWGDKAGTTFAKVDQMESMYTMSYQSPAALAGQGGVFTTPSVKPPEAFYYFPGQRRTRRMPAYSYDAPQIGYENQYTIDESYVFSGPLDRFDWKLVGKKEMLIPYNSFGAYDFAAKADDVLKPDFISVDHRRYELHRVWVVEATVKQGIRHSAPKRQFYIDEDSWSLVGGVDYDAQGKVWKVREGFAIPVYETGTCDSIGFVQYNIAEGRYVVDGAAIANGTDLAWIVNSTGNPRMKTDYYTAESLRARSER